MEEISEKKYVSNDEPAILKVAKKTSSKELSVAIVSTFKNNGYVIIKCLGVKTLYTAMKAVAFSRRDLIIADVVPVCYLSKFNAETTDDKRIQGYQIRLENNNSSQAKEVTDKDPATLKVSTNTPVDKLTSAIITTFKKHDYVIIRLIGAKAASNAVKAIIKSRSIFSMTDVDIVVYFSMFNATIDDDTRDGVQIRIENNYK